jgi:hypothetical protein
MFVPHTNYISLYGHAGHSSLNARPTGTQEWPGGQRTGGRVSSSDTDKQQREPEAPLFEQASESGVRVLACVIQMCMPHCAFHSASSSMLCPQHTRPLPPPPQPHHPPSVHAYFLCFRQPELVKAPVPGTLLRPVFADTPIYCNCHSHFHSHFQAYCELNLFNGRLDW